MWTALAKAEQETEGMESGDQEAGQLGGVSLKLYLWLVCYQSLEVPISLPRNTHLQRNLYLRFTTP